MKKVVIIIAFLLLIGLFANGILAESDSNNDEEIKKVIEKEVEGVKEKIESRIKVKNNEIEKRIKEKIENQEERIKNVREFREKIKENNGVLEIEERIVRIKEIDGEKREIIAGKINAKTGLNLTAEDIENGTLGHILSAYLSNGKVAFVKVMPDEASAIALSRLKAKCGENNCSIELKEVGSGDKTRLAYEVKTEKNSSILFIFKKKIIIITEVDAETGEIIRIKKPWWTFVANEKDENVDTKNELGLEDDNETLKGVEKVTICHIPPGNSKARNTITVGAPALKAHLAHGDYLGECEDDDNSDDGDNNGGNNTGNQTNTNGAQQNFTVQISEGFGVGTQS